MDQNKPNKTMNVHAPKILNIEGMPEYVNAAIEEISQLLASAPIVANSELECAENGLESKEIVTEVLSCPQHLLGLLIGRNGWTLKRIIRVSGANITINQSVMSTQPKRVLVYGSPSNVAIGKALVERVLQAQSQAAIEEEMQFASAPDFKQNFLNGKFQYQQEDQGDAVAANSNTSSPPTSYATPITPSASLATASTGMLNPASQAMGYNTPGMMNSTHSMGYNASNGKNPSTHAMGYNAQSLSMQYPSNSAPNAYTGFRAHSTVRDSNSLYSTLGAPQYPGLGMPSSQPARSIPRQPAPSMVSRQETMHPDTIFQMQKLQRIRALQMQLSQEEQQMSAQLQQQASNNMYPHSRMDIHPTLSGSIHQVNNNNNRNNHVNNNMLTSTAPYSNTSNNVSNMYTPSMSNRFHTMNINNISPGSGVSTSVDSLYMNTNTANQSLFSTNNGTYNTNYNIETALSDLSLSSTNKLINEVNANITYDNYDTYDEANTSQNNTANDYNTLIENSLFSK